MEKFNNPKDALLPPYTVPEDVQKKINALNPKTIRLLTYCSYNECEALKKDWCTRTYHVEVEMDAFLAQINLICLQDRILSRLTKMDTPAQRFYADILHKEFPKQFTNYYFDGFAWIRNFAVEEDLQKLWDVLEKNPCFPIPNNVLDKIYDLNEEHRKTVSRAARSHSQTVHLACFSSKAELDIFTSIVQDICLRAKVEKAWKSLPSGPRKSALLDKIAMMFPMKALNDPYLHEWYFLPALKEQNLRPMLNAIKQQLYEERVSDFLFDLQCARRSYRCMIADTLGCPTLGGQIQEIASALVNFSGDSKELLNQLQLVMQDPPRGETGRESFDFLRPIMKDLRKHDKRVLMGIVGAGEYRVRHFYSVFCSHWECATETQRQIARAYVEQNFPSNHKTIF